LDEKAVALAAVVVVVVTLELTVAVAFCVLLVDTPACHIKNSTPLAKHNGK